MFNASRSAAHGLLFCILSLSAGISFADCASLAGVPSTVAIIDQFATGATIVSYTINGEKCTVNPALYGDTSSASFDNAILGVMLYDAKIGGRSVSVGGSQPTIQIGWVSAQ